MADDDVIDLSEVRRRAWQTRRAKYGDGGHRKGAYSRSPAVLPEAVQAARDEISSVRRLVQINGLPDAWAHRAIDRLDVADHLLGGPPPIVLADNIDIPPLGPEYLGS